MDGAVLAAIPRSWPHQAALEVKASGGIEIGLKEAPSHNWDWEVPDTLDTIIRYVRAAAVKPLHGYVARASHHRLPQDDQDVVLGIVFSDTGGSRER